MEYRTKSLLQVSSRSPNVRVLLSASPVHLKVLIPSSAAGAVIGKDGEAIERIQKDSGAKVKMSKRNDFYPGKSFLHFVYSLRLSCSLLSQTSSPIVNHYLHKSGIIMRIRTC